MTVYKQPDHVTCATNRPGNASWKHSPIVAQCLHSVGLILNETYLYLGSLVVDYVI